VANSNDKGSLLGRVGIDGRVAEPESEGLVQLHGACWY